MTRRPIIRAAFFLIGVGVSWVLFALALPGGAL